MEGGTLTATLFETGEYTVTPAVLADRDPSRDPDPFVEAVGQMMWLGGGNAAWLREPDMPPMFISRNTLKDMRTWPWPACDVAIDSGGFTELGTHGRWSISIGEFAAFLWELHDWAPDNVRWAAPLDLMCEEVRLESTGLNTDAHIAMTVENLVNLRSVLPDHLARLVTPVLQGWTIDDYLRCMNRYTQAGVDLEDEPLVGIGSVCRRGDRQSVSDAADILVELASGGMRLHAFGIHRRALGQALERGALQWQPDATGTRWEPVGVVSWDSFAWSFAARRQQARMPGCAHPGDCRNCRRWATSWRNGFAAHAMAAHRRYLWGATGDDQGALF